MPPTRSTSTPRRKTRRGGYSLPTVLHTHVKTVAPTTYFGSLRRLRQIPYKHSDDAAAAALVRSRWESSEGALSSHDRDPFIKPSTLPSLYHTEEYVPKVTDRNVLGIAAYSAIGRASMT